jgi:DNA helicase IV
MNDDRVRARDELSRERDRLRYARDCLIRSREEIREMATAAASRGEDEEMIAWLYRRVRQLDDRDESPLFFGRLDGPEPQPLYIGRRYVSDTDSVPVVIDWRTDMAGRFYRATSTTPMEVTRRRRYGFSADHQLTGFDDEVLADASDTGELNDFVRRQIEQAHYGPMRDIVATIQPDQDHVVRQGADHSLVVQGGPGTGKTAVGLHRAAFLLFEYRRIREQGVLVVGPNDTFVHYISRVLPALGEIDATHTALAGLAGAERANREDTTVATLKGDARLAAVLARAMWSTVRLPDKDFVLTQTSPYVRLHPEDLARLAGDLIEQRKPFADARDMMRERLANRARRMLEQRGRAPSDRETDAVARGKQVRALVAEIWPTAKPRDVLYRLLSDADHLARCANGILTDDEQRTLLWPTPPATAARAKWSVADHFLLDELAGHIQQGRRFGHVVVDEAQDLSAMQLRAVARRCAGSVTLLGDLAQQTTPWSLSSWQEMLTILDLPGGVVTLNVSYRVPQQILDVANRLLPVVGPDLPTTRSPRSAAHSVETRLTDRIEPAVADVVHTTTPDDGSVGVIVADADVTKLVAGLTKRGIEPVDADRIDRVRRIAVVPVTQAKGLEFDHVVLVDPHRIVGLGPAGNRLLYISLTRAISRLTIIHTAALPEILGLSAA